MRRKLALLLITALLVLPVGATAQTGGTTFYVYDANGRLQTVITPDGQAAVYQYDAAGNFTSISRIPATTFQVYGLNPTSGGAGDQVTIFGTGFGAGATAVAFNGTSAAIVSTNANSVVATVPTGATSGPITVTTSAGTASPPGVFTIVSRIRIVPAAATLLLGQTFQFSDFDSVPGDTGVTWSVNGVVGGNSTVGTVSSSGLYTAPNQTSNSISVTVTSNTQPAAGATAQVSVVNPNSIAQLVSAVSVQVGDILQSTLQLQAPAISVRLGRIAGGPAGIYSSGVSVTTGPVITSISPGTVHRGSTVTTFTITGNNLSGVTSIKFFNPTNGVDSNITAANIVANGDGTSLTATLTVGSGAFAAQDTVVVTAGSLTSLAVSNATGSNTVQVQ